MRIGKLSKGMSKLGAQELLMLWVKELVEKPSLSYKLLLTIPLLKCVNWQARHCMVL